MKLNKKLAMAALTGAMATGGVTACTSAEMGKYNACPNKSAKNGCDANSCDSNGCKGANSCEGNSCKH